MQDLSLTLSPELHRCANMQPLISNKRERFKKTGVRLLKEQRHIQKQLQSKIYVQLTQKIKLKKNNIYLMHFVQPATTMLPDFISSSFCPNQTLCEVSYCPGSYSLCQTLSGQLGYRRLYAANSSFIIQSENRDGELPTK